MKRHEVLRVGSGLALSSDGLPVKCSPSHPGDRRPTGGREVGLPT